MICDLCGAEYNPSKEINIWGQYNWDIEDTALCPECSMQIQWPDIVLYRVRIIGSAPSIKGDILDDFITVDSSWVGKYRDDKTVEVTVVAPRMGV